VWNTGFAQTCSKGVTKEYRKQEASGLDLSYLRVPEQRAIAHVDASDYGVYSEPSTQKRSLKHPPVRAFMNLPNGLTLLRIFIVPVLIVVLLTRSPNVELAGFPMHFEFWGVLILLIAAATDWADGYFARRNSQVTTLGILLDPIADKLLICAAFISLVDMHLAKAWMVVIIIGRELVILGLRNIASAEGFTIAASTLGKTKMVLQVCAAAVLIYGARHPSLRTLGLVLLWLVVISALVSAAQYFYRFWNQLDDRVKQRRNLSMLEVQKKPQDALPL
jgi:CDP-diacylglycerol---glycerol-3-phosphate 3-phosphatidyltransferase